MQISQGCDVCRKGYDVLKRICTLHALECVRPLTAVHNGTLWLLSIAVTLECVCNAYV